MINGSGLRKLIANILPQGLRKFVPRSVSKHLYFNGTFPVNLGNGKFLVLQANGFILENEVFFYGIRGGHEKRAMKIWLEFCEKYQPAQVYDIGANTGIYGLVAKALSQNSHISFFEPISRAIEILEQNIELNDYEASVFQLALSNYDGEGYFFLQDGNDFAYSVTLNTHADLAITGIHNEDTLNSKVSTPVKQIATLLKNGEVEKPNLVKMDVETHESEVLEGFGFDLSEVSAFLVEVLNDLAAEKLNAIFKDLGFDFYHVDDLHDNVVKRDKIYASMNYNYFIVRPSFAHEMQTLK